MSVFDSPAFDDHEGVHFFSDPASGLRAIIAIHSIALGPAAGGCRMYPSPTPPTPSSTSCVCPRA
jgi:leucine dehydrogenase